MLDTFEIVSTSGIVLWSKTYAPVAPNLVSSFIKDVFIEERFTGAAYDDGASKPTVKRDGYTLKWTTAKDLGIIFVAVYQSLIQLTWIDQLLDNVKALFSDLYGAKLSKSDGAVVSCPFDDYFNRQVQRLEPGQNDSGASQARSAVSIEVSPPSAQRGAGEGNAPLPPGAVRPTKRPEHQVSAASDVSPGITPDSSRPGTPANNHLLIAKGGPGGRGSRRSRKAAASQFASSSAVSSGDESAGAKKPKKKSGGKQLRKWDDDGLAYEDDGNTTLDYSAPAPSTSNQAADDAQKSDAVDEETWGQRTQRGQFVLRDLDDEMDSILAAAEAKDETEGTSTGLLGSSISAIGGMFRNVVGGKTMTKEELAKSMKAMDEHLLKKNVAREAATRLCESVEKELVGSKTSQFTSIDKTIRTAMESALRKMLTPTTSLDLLRDIENVTHPSKGSGRPYVMSIVGVNGVGKSTNLSKICYFLLQNKYRVLIVAGDTFRSGAVEQLRVHVRNLQELSAREGGAVDLYERGYGKDAAHIARDAVAFAATPDNAFDVVLIDTAGRRHNDARLMSSLEKFAQLARPDKILMVGEALVGTDSVQQARNFNAAFGASRKLDGFIISKCDTVGDMVGTLVSMVHATGIPVLFLGTGQHYSDLRTLSVPWAVRLLMS